MTRQNVTAPIHVSASRSFQGHKPDSAFDKLNNTWWGPGVSESGQGQWTEATLDEPTPLLDLIITPGVSVRPSRGDQPALYSTATSTTQVTPKRSLSMP